MSIRFVCLTIAAVTAQLQIESWSFAETTSAKRKSQPNVVIVLSDDQGWGDLSVHGNKNLSTPNIDSLARDGAIFDRFFVCPVCSPTRAEFLTGRYHARGGVTGVSTGQERLDLDERTIADVFKAAGYKTGAFGKWHNGMQHPYHPNARGFDEYYGFCSGHWGDYFDAPMDHNGEMVQGKGFIIDDLTNHAIDFITQFKDQPFLCYVPYNTPHSPMQVPDEYWNRFSDKELVMRDREPDREDIPKTRAALAMCENIDWNVGRLLDKLNSLGLAENTIVVYFADNGPNGARWNDGMKGQKGSVDEGGVRSPLLIRWPAAIAKGTRIEPIAGAIDLLPTLADLAGISLVNTKPLDGLSLKKLLLPDSSSWPARELVTMWGGRMSIRTQQYRLDSAGSLFDMVADPGQRRDVSAERPETAQALKTSLDRWRDELKAELPSENRPFTVGYSAITPLPARDGVPHGKVRRSAGAPNCSFFTNWTADPQDRITWDIQVGTAGDYEVIVYYTCAAENVGAQIEASFEQSRTRAKVTEAFDPPLRGEEHDRVPRKGESYVKDFKPLHLGHLKLSASHGELALKATDVPGKGVIDVRYVVLRKM